MTTARRRAVEVVGLALALAVAFATRRGLLISVARISYDDGAYLASAEEVSHGLAPFRSVYSSQGPLWLPVLAIPRWVASSIVWAPRLVPLAGALGLVVFGHRLARAVGGPLVAGAAALLIATSGTVAYGSTWIEADGVALALGAGTLFAAAAPKRARPVVVGLIAGAGMSVKILAAPAIAGALWLLWRRQGGRAAATATGVGAGIGLGLSLLWGIGSVWEQYVALHLDGRASSIGPLDNFASVRTALYERDRLVLAMLVLALVGAAARVARRRSTASRRDVAEAFWVWLALAAALLALHSPVMRQHLGVIVVPMVLLGAAEVGRWRRPANYVLAASWVVIAVVVAALVLPDHGVRNGWRFTPIGPLSNERAMMALLARIEPADALVISDDPGLVYFAGRRLPGDLVDVSFTRIGAGALTTEDVAEAATDPKVCGVMFWTTRFDALPGLAARLSGWQRLYDHGPRVLFLRPECRLRKT